MNQDISMSTYDETHSETREIPAVDKPGAITISRLTNLLLMALYAAAMVLHIICLSVMAAKHNELVDKFSDNDYYNSINVKEGCILFVDYDGLDSETGVPQIKWVNNKCHIVIYGSAALGGCALVMIVVLAMKTLLFRR